MERGHSCPREINSASQASRQGREGRKGTDFFTPRLLFLLPPLWPLRSLREAFAFGPDKHPAARTLRAHGKTWSSGLSAAQLAGGGAKFIAICSIEIGQRLSGAKRTHSRDFSAAIHERKTLFKPAVMGRLQH